ncbi:galactokinase [Paenibacillus sp. ACRRX]|uniref:galactokinase n=1 Tax=Paenibacillus sp. ACRRX TaxID=2918206 RepID=UPI001EF47A4C|nr:galactokinase [Paenibacillus sp. ACRRX]MCG7410281.1 galactokinase [Paenibacillus sp. ACRRX]
MDTNRLLHLFEQHYGINQGEVRLFHAPGRVNLIGEHLDYNGGYVLPAALQIGTYLLIRSNADRMLRLASVQFEEAASFSIDELPTVKSDMWTDYPLGVVHEMNKAGHPITQGYDLLVAGNIPNGAGLSSSASLEVVIGYALLTLEGYPIDRTALARLSQRAENQFVGVNSGIMDQFAVSHGKQDHAILLDCDSLQYEHVPFQIQGYKLIIGNTNKRRGLVDSKYNERRTQCDEAVEKLKQVYPDLTYLAHLTSEQFQQAKHVLTDRVVCQRAEHVVFENERVKQSMKALREGDLLAFGQLMNASHESLRDLYEVSCEELDVMVQEARTVNGTIGSRMTGAGFGGCTVSLVAQAAVEDFVNTVGANYERHTGLKPDFYVCDVGDGVIELEWPAFIATDESI